MNLIYYVQFLIPFLDLVPMTHNFGTTSPETKVVILAVLAIFLAFVGYLLWRTLRKKDK